MSITILLAGFAFGLLMSYARVNRYNTISGMSTWEDLTMAKVMAFAIGLGMILIGLEIEMGWASYHVKPLMMGGIAIGGLMFGWAMAVLGYCPGTLPISLGQGSLDAGIGILGGLLGGLTFTMLEPEISGLLGPNLGSESLYTLVGSYGIWFHIILFSIGLGLMYLAYRMHLREPEKGKKWMVTGIGFALLNALLMLDSGEGRPIGASTAYPYLADLMAGYTDNTYFDKISTPGEWEILFIAGSILAGLAYALYRKEFKWTSVHSRWIKYKGESKESRLIWAFTAGFFLIFGARMAGGCSSGHILSGGMQTAISALVFSLFVFAAFFATGKWFYKKKE